MEMENVFRIIIFFFGASIGSFIGAAVSRMENKKSILRGRSECEACGEKINWRDLIPVFSYLYLRGKCRRCGKPIGISAFLVEIVCGALFLFAFVYHQGLPLFRDWIFLAGLVFLFIYDLKYKVLPDLVTIPVAAVVFIINIILGYKITGLLLGVAIGGGFFLLQYLVSRGRWVGDGDIRMGALLGAALGFPNVVFALFVAYILGGFYSGYLLLRKQAELKSQLAFGTFLAAGGVISLYWGQGIINWYLKLK